MVAGQRGPQRFLSQNSLFHAKREGFRRTAELLRYAS
jgi:hypothetical protein